MYSLYTDKSNKIFGLRMTLPENLTEKRQKSTNTSVKILDRK